MARMVAEVQAELNGVTYRLPDAPVAVICVDGGDPAYFTAAQQAGVIPTMARFMASGFSAVAHCGIPSFTCPNNISIATGAPPKVHGISGNFYLDRHTGQAVVMTGPELLRSRTIFDVIAEAGARVAVVTAKDKLRRQLGKGLDLGAGNVCFSAQLADQSNMEENGVDDALDLVGRPLPDMYSADLSLFVLDAGIRLLEQDSPPQLLYLSLTDYIQHKYPPDHPEALAYHAELDRRCARLEQLGAIVALAADHGMTDKCAADGSYHIVYLQDLLDARFGAGTTKVICPITDAFVGHHGSLGGFVRVHCLADGVQPAAVAELARGIEGIDLVLEREDAARRFDLPYDVEGDVVVISSADYCVGMRRSDHDLAELHGERLRSHGGISEREVAFIVSRPLNATYLARAQSQQLMNHHVFDFAINGTT